MQLVQSLQMTEQKTTAVKKKKLTQSTHFHTFSKFSRRSLPDLLLWNSIDRIAILTRIPFSPSSFHSFFPLDRSDKFLNHLHPSKPPHRSHENTGPWRCVTGSFSSRGVFASIFNSARGETKLAFAAANMAVCRGWRNSSSNFKGLPSTLCALENQSNIPWFDDNPK